MYPLPLALLLQPVGVQRLEAAHLLAVVLQYAAAVAVPQCVVVAHQYVRQVEVRQCVRLAAILEAILAVVHLRLEAEVAAHVDNYLPITKIVKYHIYKQLSEEWIHLY